MRIAHFDTGRSWRGGQRQVLLLLSGLMRRGHEVALLAPDGPLLEAAGAAGARTMAFRGHGEFDLTSGIRAASRLSSWGPGLLHAHTAHAHTIAVRAAPRLGCPVVVSRRVLTPVRLNPFSRRKYARGVARYLCISRAVVASMRASGIPAERLALVPSAIDLEALGAIRERVARGLVQASLRALIGAPSGPIVVTAGALTAEKEPERFAALAEEVERAGRPAHFVWLGDGPLAQALARDARSRRNVHVLGFRADVYELMAQCDLFVSCSRSEGLGGAVLESQALGVPVIARDSGGVRDAIADGSNGRVVEPQDLGAAVIAALDDPDTSRRWARAALESVASFGVDAMTDATLAEYTRVLEQARMPAQG